MKDREAELGIIENRRAPPPLTYRVPHRLSRLLPPLEKVIYKTNQVSAVCLEGRADADGFNGTDAFSRKEPGLIARETAGLTDGALIPSPILKPYQKKKSPD